MYVRLNVLVNGGVVTVASHEPGSHNILASADSRDLTHADWHAFLGMTEGNIARARALALVNQLLQAEESRK